MIFAVAPLGDAMRYKFVINGAGDEGAAHPPTAADTPAPAQGTGMDTAAAGAAAGAAAVSAAEAARATTPR